MQDFQKSYIEKMGSRIEALLSASQGLDVDFFESASSIRRLAHTLRGSGATFGFPEITELAAATEDAPDTDLKTKLQLLIEYLQTLYEDHRPEQEKLLVIDDSEDIRLMLSVILKAQGYDVSVAETAEAGRALLDEHSFKLLILDLVLPDMDGRNFLIKLREDPKTAMLPVLVLSAKNSPQIKAECFALGADDYFEKPLDPALLTTRVAVSLQRSRQMEKQTHRDTLTGLPNRAAFSEAFESKRSVDNLSKLCVAMLDIDHFKKINDEYGHITGDEVLKHTAESINSQLKSADILARWGGEEFAALITDSDLSSAKFEMRLALQYVREHPYQTAEGKTVPLSFSGGIHQVQPGEVLSRVLAKADHLLYRAKAAGRNCVLSHEDELDTRPKKILIAEDDELTAEFMNHRLRKDGFELDHYLRGDLALEAARQEKYDLAIFDVKMPGMEGFELLQRVRNDSLNSTTPIIMLTSMGSEQDISRGLSLGANDYVLKPFSPMELMARIRRLLK